MSASLARTGFLSQQITDDKKATPTRSLVSEGFMDVFLIQRVDEQAGAELRLEPGCLWRHYVAGVGNVDKLLHRNRVEGESHLHLPAVHPAAEFAESADPTDKVDSLVCPEILDAQNPVQNQIGEDGHIEHSDRIGVVVASLTGLEGPTIPNLPSDEVPVGGYKYVRG